MNGGSYGGYGGGNSRGGADYRSCSGFQNFSNTNSNYNNNAFPASGAGNHNKSTSYSYGGDNIQDVNWDRQNLNPIKKSLYNPLPAVFNRKQEEVEKWIADNQVTLKGHNLPRPVFEFDESTFPEIGECGNSSKWLSSVKRKLLTRDTIMDLMLELLYKSYQKPTVIQSISWPVALSGMDMVSIAKTGSGKTLAFILPGIVHTLAQGARKQGEGPAVLVLLPTRELAQQVEEVAMDYCKAMNLNIVCLYGGASKLPQASALRNGIDICIATPGRLLDFIQEGYVSMTRCSYLVLDEADRMLDMGFEPQIRKIINQIRPDRQTLMFSATWPKEVCKLASDFQKNPVFLNVGSMELSANHNIEQHVEVLDEHQKLGRLMFLLDKIGQQVECKTIIFVETKRKADELTHGMRTNGWPALCIHGDKTQSERNWVMSEFREGKAPILLATDVAARGLDVDDIKFVINYDYPKSSEDYVHRIGRTARHDKQGTSYTFFTRINAPKARDLIKVLEEAKQLIPEKLALLANGGGGSYGGPGGYVRRAYPNDRGDGAAYYDSGNTRW